jgi:hypothetical protein
MRSLPSVRRGGGRDATDPPFQREYNTERPHERLGQRTPASCYHASVTPYPERLPPLEYPGHFLVKKIITGGTFRFRNRLLYLANAMVDQHIGLEETDDGVRAIWFNTVLLATFDEHDYIITGRDGNVHRVAAVFADEARGGEAGKVAA